MTHGVVTLVRSASEVKPLVAWAMRIARALLVEEVGVLQLSGASAEGRDIDLEDEELHKDKVVKKVREVRQGVRARATPAPAHGWHEGDPIPNLTMRRIGVAAGAAESDADAALVALLDELRRHPPRLLVIGDGEGAKSDRRLTKALRRRAPCEVLWLRCREEVTRAPFRVLVPIAGGPNAEPVLELAAALANSTAGEVHALMVEPQIGEDAEAVGLHIAEGVVRRAVARHRDRISVMVAVAARDGAVSVEDVGQAIKDRCEHGEYTLLLAGASPFGALRRFFAGSVTDGLREAASSPTAVGVYRQAMPFHSRVGSWLDRFSRAHVPQLDRQGRLEFVAKIQQSSHWNFDFVALVCLSTLIAGLGLIRDSGAVVIGAMLVAPLMTPLVGCGLAIVQGNTLLIRGAARAVALGFLLAFAIGVGLGLVLGQQLPLGAPTTEMVMRGGPNGIDLAIAVASGLAAAYATARPGLTGAIPGVAIAAALVPPIATSGLALSLGEGRLALGAFLLFFANIVAIVVSSAVSLFAVGLRLDRQRKTSWQLRLWLGLLIVVALLLALFPAL